MIHGFLSSVKDRTHIMLGKGDDSPVPEVQDDTGRNDGSSSLRIGELVKQQQQQQQQPDCGEAAVVKPQGSTDESNNAATPSEESHTSDGTTPHGGAFGQEEAETAVSSRAATSPRPPVMDVSNVTTLIEHPRTKVPSAATIIEKQTRASPGEEQGTTSTVAQHHQSNTTSTGPVMLGSKGERIGVATNAATVFIPIISASVPSPGPSLCVNPTDIDVIFGRGEPTRKHPGNVILRDHVSRWLQEYMASSKSSKSHIIRRVIQEIDNSGARYLVPLDPSCRQTIFTAGCREATKTEVRSKVSHAFRDGERRAILQQKTEEENDETATPTSLKAIANTVTVTVTVTVTEPTGTSIPKPNEQNGDTAVDPSTRQSSTPAPATDLLSFANILTSLKNTSSPPPPLDGAPLSASVSSSPLSTSTSPPSIPRNRLEVLTQQATSSLSAISATTPSKSNSKKPKASIKQQAQKQRGKKYLKHEASSSPSSNKNKNKQGSSASRSCSSIVENLKQHCQTIDIVFGRGAPLRQHPGNIQFRKMVGQYNERYGAASKHEKTSIIQCVIREIIDQGAKFLIMNDSDENDDDTDGPLSSGRRRFVTEASSDEIRMKVSHRFRDFNKGRASSAGLGTKRRAKQQQEQEQQQTKEDDTRASETTTTTTVEQSPSPCSPHGTNSKLIQV